MYSIFDLCFNNVVSGDISYIVIISYIFICLFYSWGLFSVLFLLPGYYLFVLLLFAYIFIYYLFVLFLLLVKPSLKW